MKLSRRLANLDWMAAVLTPVAIVMMEVYWFYPWLVWTGRLELFGAGRAPLSLGAAVFLMGGAYATTRYLLGKHWPVSLLRWGIVIAGLAFVFSVLRSEYHGGYELTDGRWFGYAGRLVLDSFTTASPFIVALPAAAYLWWRGISRGRTEAYVADIYRTLVTGTGAFVLLIIAWSASLGTGSLGSMAAVVAPDVAAFFFFGLAGLALANLQGIRRRALPDETVRSFNRRWVPVLVIVVGGIVLLGVGLSALFSPEFMGLLAGLLGSAADLLRQLITYILIPLGYVAAVLVWVGTWLINLIRSADPPRFPSSPFATGEDEMEEIPQGEPIPEAILLVLKWVLFAVAVIAVAYLVSRAVSRFRASRTASEADEFSESLWTWGGFRADVAAFLSALWQRLWRRKRPGEEYSPVPNWYDREPAQEVRLSIREIYQRLLWQGFRFGVRHRSPETPLEYQRRLEPRVPEGTGQLVELTGLYERVRYGELAASEAQVDRANSLWRSLRQLLGARH